MASLLSATPYTAAPNTKPVDTTKPATSASGVTWNPRPAPLVEPPPLLPPPPLPLVEVGSADVAAVAVVRLLALLDKAAKPMAVGLYRKTLKADPNISYNLDDEQRILTNRHSLRMWLPRSTG